MPVLRQCQSCGRDLPPDSPSGQCVACLLNLALAGSTPGTRSRRPDDKPPVGPDAANAAESSEEETRGAARRFSNYELLDGDSGKAGGMGIVFRARDLRLNRIVALKQIRSESLPSPTALERFRLEAEAAARLDHPHIVPIYEVGEHAGQHFFTMRYLEGGSLADELDRQGGQPLPVRRAATLVAAIARAVHHAHQRGVLHRDLKPGNILLDRQGLPHVTDFGLAKWIESDTDLTTTGQVMGSLGYMSPEQAQGRNDEVNKATDIFSLGAVLYQLLTGRVPFSGVDMMDTLRRICLDEPRSLCGLNKHVDRDLETICLKCLEKEPAHRYASARQLAEDLERWLNHETISVRPATTWERAWKWCRRRPLPAALLAVITLAVLITTGLSLHSLRQSRLAREHAAQAQAERHQKELQSADKLLRRGPAAAGLAQLAGLVREAPTNQAAATRLLSALTQRSWPILRRQFTLDAELRAIAVSPDGHNLAAADSNGVLSFGKLNADVATPLAHRLSHDGAVSCLAFSPDGQLLAGGGRDRLALVWELASGKTRHRMGPHASGVRQVRFSPNGQQLLTLDAATATLWESATGKKIKSFPAPSADDRVRVAAFSPDGKRLALGTQLGQVQVRALSNNDPILKLGSHPSVIVAAQFSPNTSMLLVASKDGLTRLWSLDAAQVVAEFNPGPDLIAAALDPHGAWVLTARANGALALWTFGGNGPRGTALNHEQPLQSAGFSPNGLTAFSVGMDGLVKFWDVLLARPLGEPIHARGPLLAAQFSPDGRHFFTAGPGHTVSWWEVSPGEMLPALAWDRQDFDLFRFSAQGQWLAAVSNHMVALYAVQQPARPPRWLAHSAPVETVAFDPAGTRLAMAGHNGQVAVVNLATAQRQSLAHTGPVRLLVFDPAGNQLFAATDAAGCMWNLQTKPPRRTALIAQAQRAGDADIIANITAAAFGPDGRRLATVSGRDVWVWGVTNGQRTGRHFAHAGLVTLAEFSPDGQWLLTAGLDGQVHLWSLVRDTSRPLPHQGPVNDARFSPDGRRVVTAADDHNAQVWNVATGERIGEPLKHADRVNSAAFSPDGRWVVTSARNRLIQVWDAATGLPVTESWRAEGTPFDARFCTDGRWILSRSGEVWEFLQPPAPAPDWLPLLAEVVGGLRQQPEGGTTRLPAVELLKVQQQLRTKSGTAKDRLWLDWLLADRATRPLSPSVQFTASNYVAHALRVGSFEALTRANRLAPTNTAVHDRLLKGLAGQ